jgi:O-antigen ligase
MVVIHDRRWLLPGALLIVLGVLVVNNGSAENLTEADPVAVAVNVVHSAQGRIELWSRGLMMLQDFPLTGIGFGMVVDVMPLLYPTFVVPNDAGIEHVHSLYLEAGVDLGYPGIILTLAFLFGMLFVTGQAVGRARDEEIKPLASAMLVTVVVYAVHGLIDNLTFYAKAHLIAWALFGVAVAVALHLLPTRALRLTSTPSRKT